MKAIFVFALIVAMLILAFSGKLPRASCMVASPVTSVSNGVGEMADKQSEKGGYLIERRFIRILNEDLEVSLVVMDKKTKAKFSLYIEAKAISLEALKTVSSLDVMFDPTGEVTEMTGYAGSKKVFYQKILVH